MDFQVASYTAKAAIMPAIVCWTSGHDRTTKGRILRVVRHEGTKLVLGGSNRSGAWATLAIAVALGGCAKVDFDAGGAWFQKPLDVFGRKGGYTYSELGEAKKQQRPITANDLVDAGGACPLPAAPQAAGSTAGPGPAPAAAPAAAPDSSIGGGVALGMTECEVVSHVGTPNSVQIGKNPNGDRTAVLTYNVGSQPGIYHFERGQLMEMDRVAAPPSPPVAKKKPAKTSKQAAKD
jgi:hypothetical protein